MKKVKKKVKKKAKKKRPKKTQLPRGTKGSRAFKELKRLYRELRDAEEGEIRDVVMVKVPVQVYWDGGDRVDLLIDNPHDVLDEIHDRLDSTAVSKKWNRKARLFDRNLTQLSEAIDLNDIDVWRALWKALRDR